MTCNIRVTLIGLTAFQVVFALNPIHEASYNLVPSSNFQCATTLSGGAYVHSQTTSTFDMPVAIALQATPRVELGARLQSRWGDVEDNLPYLIFGVKWLTLKHTSVQADLMIGTNLNTGKGFSISTHHKFQYFSWFSAPLVTHFGFMEAMVDRDALMAMEIGYYPTLAVARNLALECGLISSSQTNGFEDYLAMDLQPALRVKFGHQSELVTALAIGLAGRMREKMRAKVVINYGI